MSGMRAENFGDLIFLDHGEFKLGVDSRGKPVVYVFLVIVDGCSMLIDLFLCKTKEDDESAEHLREWMDRHHIRPKVICGDQAFFTPKPNHLYSYHNIRPITLGPRTPWPNRAESAVRLTKQHVAKMCS